MGVALFRSGEEAPPGDKPPERTAKELAAGARATLTTYCHRCHGEGGAVEGGFNYLLDRARLVARKKIVPGHPDQSALLRRIRDGEMPPEGEDKRPGKDDIALLERWIEAGAPDFNVPAARPTSLATPEIARWVRDDLRTRNERDRRFTRYFSLAHLADAGLSADELLTYRNGVAKLVNSLSWGRRIVVPAAVDPQGTVLRVDLRDYLWTEEDWNTLLAGYVYGVIGVSPEQEYARTATGCRLPVLRGDWFVATASRPPLYHRLLKLPATARELEAQLRVDVAANLRGERVARAGFNGSGVSRHNRLLERHETPSGAYWKTYDFAGADDVRNLFDHPLGPDTGSSPFRQDGGEILFNLPNGLQAYMLIDGRGRRIDKAPTAIVSDPRRADRAVENGLSCMACHAGGVNPKRDQIRAHVLKNRGSFSREEVETVQALYPPAEKFDALLREDAERFRRAAALTGARVGKTEPIQALAEQFERELDLARAAAEAGLRPEEFRTRLRRTTRLGRSLGPLLLDGGTIQRQAFTSAFAELTDEWGLGKPLTGLDATVTVRPDEAAIPAPRLTRPVTEVMLPTWFSQICTGGAGRYLIFHLKQAKKLAVFDVSQAKVAYTIDVPADDVLYAAGRDKLMVVVPGQRLLQRRDLRTGKLEKTVPLPGGPVLSALMGCAGHGPLLLFSDGRFLPWDVRKMEPAGLDIGGLGGSPRWKFQGRISADGQTVIVWHGGLSPSSFCLVHLARPKNTVIGSPDGHSMNERWAMPNADGSLILRYDSGIYTGDMKVVAAGAFKGAVLLPTEDPRFFLAVRPQAADKDQVTICTTADYRPLFTVKDLERTTRSSMSTRHGQFDGEPRHRYLPSANVLISLPEEKNRVVLRPFNLMEALDKSGEAYLFVLSRPPTHARAGAPFRYQMDVRSKAGGVRYELASGPKGMTLSGAGEVRWKVPAELRGKFVPVIVTLRDASGKDTAHSFEIKVE